MILKNSRGLLIVALTFFFMMKHVNLAYALGDYHYCYLHRQVNEIDNMGIRCVLEVGCSTYCFWDRVIKVKSDTGYASMADGPSSCEIVGYSLAAKKINDYKIVVIGVVQVKTADKYSRKQAKELGLIGAGFYPGSNNDNWANYYKLIDVSLELQP